MEKYISGRHMPEHVQLKATVQEVNTVVLSSVGMLSPTL